MEALMISTFRTPFTNGFRIFSLSAVLLFCALYMFPISARAATPDVGEKAPDFTLSTPSGTPVHFKTLFGNGEVVLVILRGYPGYQCPYCQRQFHDFVQNGSKFADANAQLLLVYPGPPAELAQRAKEFTTDQHLPSNIHLVIDPNYVVTNLYGLRWDAPKETAYPSTFLLDPKDVIVFRKISRSHGDRTTAADILSEIAKSKKVRTSKSTRP